MRRLSILIPGPLKEKLMKYSFFRTCKEGKYVSEAQIIREVLSRFFGVENIKEEVVRNDKRKDREDRDAEGGRC